MPYRLRNPREPLLSTGDVAEQTGFSPATITSWCRTGKVRAYVTPGGHYRLRLSDVWVYIHMHYEYEDDIESDNEG
jgi:excisionase family DNA binding protein